MDDIKDASHYTEKVISVIEVKIELFAKNGRSVMSFGSPETIGCNTIKFLEKKGYHVYLSNGQYIICW